MNLVNLVFDANLVQSLYELLLEADNLPHIIQVALPTNLVHSHDLDIQQCQILQLVHLPLIILDCIQDVERYELAN